LHIRFLESQALEVNRPFATACYLKEDLRQLWNQPNKEIAENFSGGGLVARENSSKIPILMKFASTLQKHREGIPALYDYPIATEVPWRALTTKSSPFKKRAYCFRDMEFFKLKICALRTAKHPLAE
jgi:transposase